MATRIHGIAASENLDTSGERIIIAGLDISSLEKDGVFNWEHKSDQPAQLVGKILKAKKIFSSSDCSNEDEKHFWDKVKVPFVYVMGELMDDYKESAKEVAGTFKYDYDHRDRDTHAVSNFSIEGARIEKKGMDITRSIARKVTITVHACNKAAVGEYKPEKDESKRKDIESLFKSEIEIELFKSEGDELAKIMGPKPDAHAHAHVLGIEPMKKDLGFSAGSQGSIGGLLGSEKMPEHKQEIKKDEPAKVSSQPAPLAKAGIAPKSQISQLATPKKALTPPGDSKGIKLGITSTGKDIHSHKRVHEYGPMTPKEHHEAANLHFNAASAATDGKMGAHHMDKVRLHMQAAKTAEMREQRLKAPAHLQIIRKGEMSEGTGIPTKKDKEHLNPPKENYMGKAMDAGSGMAAPSQLVQSSALAKQNLDKKKKFKKNKWLDKAEEEYQAWEKREEFVKFMEQRLPNLKRGEIDAIGRAIALKKGSEESKSFLAKMGYSHMGSSIEKGSDVMMEAEKNKAELKKKLAQ